MKTSLAIALAIAMLAAASLVSANGLQTMDLECSQYGSYQGIARYTWNGDRENPIWPRNEYRHFQGCAGLGVGGNNRGITITGDGPCPASFMIVKNGLANVYNDETLPEYIYTMNWDDGWDYLGFTTHEVILCKKVVSGSGSSNGGSGSPHGVPEFNLVTLAAAITVAGLGLAVIRKRY
jgi:hypothetical protein